MAKKELASIVNGELEKLAIQRGLIDDSGRPNVGRLLSLHAYANLQSTIKTRSDKKTEAGHESKPGGLNMQINIRTKKALGISVPEAEKDQKLMRLVGFIRVECDSVLSEPVDWYEENWEDLDRSQKQKIYAIIDRMIKMHKAGNAE